MAKIARGVPEIFSQTDRHRQTDTLITILRSRYAVKVINTKNSEQITLALTQN